MTDKTRLSMRNDQFRDFVKTKVIEYTNEEGTEYFIERFETDFTIAEIDSSQKYKIGCEPCKQFGRNLACPPYSPYLLEYIKDCMAAKIICLRVPLEQFPGTITEERYHPAFRIVRALLTDELLWYRKTGQIVAGSGACLACGRCVIESGETQCVRPSKKIYSLESLGVNVVSLTEKAFHFKLEWSGCETAADFVSAVGAVFFRRFGKKGNGIYEKLPV